MVRRVSVLGLVCLRENDELVGDSEKLLFWLVCNVNGCYWFG